jgi:glycosyltransferase involved in cell wall biosynthesis
MAHCLDARLSQVTTGNVRQPFDATQPVRIAALASHPVMYQCELYRLLASDPRVRLKVIFASNVGVRTYRDSGFGGQMVRWESDLLTGYEHSFLKNADINGVERFFDLTDWDILSEVRPDRYDVLWVHSYSSATVWLAIAAAKLHGIPLMIREDQTLLHGRPWWKRGVRAVILRALFRGAWGLSVGSRNRAFFLRFGMRKDRIRHVAYTPNNEAWQREARRLLPDRASIRASFGVHDDRPVILFVGKLQAKKQPEALLEAFRQVRERQPCALMFVGTGELESRLRQTVADHSVPDVIFVGFLNRSEIGQAYIAADLLVLPSAVNETWGMVVNEAMNFSLPVIVSDKVGCAPDLVQNGDNGYVFDYRAVQDLTNLLAKLVTDSDLRKRLGRRSLERITQWSPRVAADGLIEAALAAAKGGRSVSRGDQPDGRSIQGN